MSAAAAAILVGMPEPSDLRLHRAGGRCVITAGSVVLFDYDEADVVMRNLAISALRRLEFTGRRVAAVMGLTENYVATLHAGAVRDGSAALIRRPGPGRPGKLGDQDWADAAAWRARGLTDTEIGQRLGVAHTTVARRLGSKRQQKAEAPAPAGPAAPVQQELPVPAWDEPEPAAPGQDEPVPAAADPAGDGAAGPGITAGTFASRYAGAMLLHAFATASGAGGILAGVAGQDPGGERRYADVALLSAASICFALGFATIEQYKHLPAGEAGPLAGLPALPGQRTFRPRLAALADAIDPAELQALFAAAMLAAEPALSGIYYVDDHFVAYTGAKPVGKGWNNKRGRAEKGHADTHVTTADGRAVCFVTGEPSGLTVTLPRALAELKRAAGPGAKIMLGFDRGGAYPQVFRHCREEGVHWVTYRRAPLAVPRCLPVLTTITAGGRVRQIAWAEETVQLKDYGEARQITLFEHGQVALQILTSDTAACPADILTWLKSRWREENFLKYASENYGIDKICDYAAAIGTNTKIIDNPARKTARAATRAAEAALGRARADLAALLRDPAIPAPDKNTRLIPAAHKKITAAERRAAAAQAALGQIPARLPANEIDPGAQIALLHASRRALQMVLRLLAHNAEHWLATHLNAYLRDDDEYRATTRQTIIRGLAGTITYTTAAITVTLQAPRARTVTSALRLLLDEINQNPPNMPGDTRPITYQLTSP
jgi:transposase-like protein